MVYNKHFKERKHEKSKKRTVYFFGTVHRFYGGNKSYGLL